MRTKFSNVMALPGFEVAGPAPTMQPAPVPAILRGYSGPEKDPRPDVDDMTAEELRAELAASGHDEDAIDHLPNWTALRGAVRKLRRP